MVWCGVVFTDSPLVVCVGHVGYVGYVGYEHGDVLIHIYICSEPRYWRYLSHGISEIVQCISKKWVLVPMAGLE
jgi:hypothetical protein